MRFPFRGLCAVLIAFSAWVAARPASAAFVTFEAHTPATGDYTAYCDGNIGGLRYCNFTNSFEVSADHVVNALVFFDLGCNIADQSEMTFFYDLATWDTFQIVATSMESITVTCAPEFPASTNIPFVLPIPPTTLEARRPYFLLQRASNNERARAFWGIDNTNSQTSFQVLSDDSPPPPLLNAPVVWAGAWSPIVTYLLGEAVSFNGSGYVSVANDNTGNVPDISPTYWDLLAQKGDVGATGDTGPQGPPGPPGPAGADGADGVSGSVIAGTYANVGTNRFLVPWGNTTVGVESSAEVPVPSGTAGRLVVSLTTAPGIGGSATITIRRNGSNTALACTVAATETTCSNTTDTVVFNNGDLLSILYTEVGAVGARIRFGFEYRSP